MMKRLVYSLVFIVCIVGCSPNRGAAELQIDRLDDEAKNIIIANDLGRNGYYEQRTIAELMGETAAKYDVEYIAALGDVHHFDGVRSVNDPLWRTNYEDIYKHPELMIEWKAICGNHEYRGNTQAVSDYSQISRRWIAPAKYYAERLKLESGDYAKLIWIDTAPLIDKYRTDSLTYPDACKQSKEQQLAWLDSTLNASKERWIIVMGHHPVYAETPKDDSERTDLQKRVEPLLTKYGVHAYFAGHIHNFQHLKKNDTPTHYFVNSSGSLSRPVRKIEHTVAVSADPGFTLLSMWGDRMMITWVNHKGETVYQYTISNHPEPN